jgi:beta-galactosidase
MFFGLAYYPEHWPEERWPVDAKMMQEARVNGVRMGEFAWSKVEPRQGQYDFTWLDQAVELLAKHGIKTMMCTCSRTPPPWVFHKYPEIRNVRADGKESNYGHRYTICHNNPTFIELAQQIDRKFIEHYAGNENVISWHIDNEIGSGNTCYCEICHKRFIEYLCEKYQTVENLNQKWGEHFWSFAFSSFDEVPLPIGVSMAYPSLALEYARFQSKVNTDFARWRYRLMKELHPQAWITTNFQSSRATHTDIFEMGQYTDVYGTNFYPNHNPEFALDYCRGARGKLIILEQRSGSPHWRPGTQPGWMRLWTYRSIAHGATGINYFRWRTARYGHEEYWHGVLPHSGRANRRYDELKQTGEELDRIGAAINATQPAAQAAVVMSYESRWALHAISSTQVLSPLFGTDELDVHEEAKAVHTALMDNNITTDALDPREDLSKYKLVIAPRLYVVDQPIAQNLRRFVEDGGVLCLTPRSGVADEYNVIFDQPSPGPLAEIAGVEIDDYSTLEGPVTLKTAAGGPQGAAEGTLWLDEIVLTTAQAAAHYDSSWAKGIPAVTVNAFGKGKVVYLGTALREENMHAFIAWLADLAGVPVNLVTPAGVRAYERQSEQHRLLFLLNFSQETHTIDLGAAWQDLLAGQETTQVHLPPAAVSVLQRDKA